MRERRGSDTSAYQGELTGRERWTGACKGGRKTLKKRENLTTPTDIKLRKHSKRTESRRSVAVTQGADDPERRTGFTLSLTRG